MTRMKKKQIAAFPKKQILQLALKDAEKLHNLLMLNGFVMHWNLFNYYQPVCFAFIYLTIFNITVQCNTEMHKNWIFVIFLCQLAFSCILFRSTVLSSWFPSQQHVHVKLVNKLPHTHTHTTLPGPPGWASARREFLDFMVQGKINRGRHTDHLAGHHSIWTNQCPPPPTPHFFTGRMPFLSPNQQRRSTEGKLVNKLITNIITSGTSHRRHKMYIGHTCLSVERTWM